MFEIFLEEWEWIFQIFFILEKPPTSWLMTIILLITLLVTRSINFDTKG